MSDIKARFWVDALRWRAEAAGASVYVSCKGDPDAGAVLVKVLLPGGRAALYAPARDFQGERVWTRPLGEEPVPERDADAYAERRRDRDPDIWVVEIDDPHGRDFLNEPIEKS
ncbi:MAG: DUF1491 family protein [Oceanicaulis sp.]